MDSLNFTCPCCNSWQGIVSNNEVLIEDKLILCDNRACSALLVIQRKDETSCVVLAAYPSFKNSFGHSRLIG